MVNKLSKFAWDWNLTELTECYMLHARWWSFIEKGLIF